MSLRIGRLGLEFQQTNVASLEQSGDEVYLSGRVSSSAGFNAYAIRDQLNGLANNPHEPVVPVSYDDFPWIDGYYRVNSVEVGLEGGSLRIGYFPFACRMTRVASYSSPLMENRILGSVRPNSWTVTTAMPTTTVPGESLRWSGPPTVTSSHERLTADGPVRTYVEPAGATPALFNATTTYLVRPRDYYTGSARIRVGPTTAVSSTTWEASGAVESWEVPAGVTLITADVRGAQGGGTQGGYGARVLSQLAVTPGEILSIVVGICPTGRAGGWPNGGDGAANGTTSNNWGKGGGGRSEIRRGVTKITTAGGGGGEQKDLSTTGSGGKGGLLGTDAGGLGGGQFGKGGTNTAGGVGWPAGAPRDGASYQGGDAPNTYPYNGGGGGDGFYGGSGAQRGGGGGSSNSDDTLALYQTGANRGGGSITISYTDLPSVVERFDLVGDQNIDSPFGWELSNGMIRVTPVQSSATTSLLVGVWNGVGWYDGWEWRLTDGGSSTAAAGAFFAGFSVIANNPAECIIRVGLEYPSERNAIQLTLALKRGSPIFDVNLHCSTAKPWGWRLNRVANGTNTGVGGGYTVQTAAEIEGSKYLHMSPDAGTTPTGSGVDAGRYITTDETTLQMAIGAMNASSTNTAAQLVSQWYAALTESVRAVLR